MSLSEYQNDLKIANEEGQKSILNTTVVELRQKLSRNDEFFLEISKFINIALQDKLIFNRLKARLPEKYFDLNNMNNHYFIGNGKL